LLDSLDFLSETATVGYTYVQTK